MAKSKQTKGWLDNYNDSNAFASPDMVGDGFSNVGRNSSPAWGGAFQMGGSIPQAQNGYRMGTYFDEDAREREPNMMEETYDDYNTGMTGMMKSKIGMGNAFGHPAIKRMSQAMPKTGMTPEGLGTHYMSSMCEDAVPLLQDTGKDQLEYFENPRPSSEDIRFNSPEEAQYFAEHYKDVAPMSNTYKGLQEYAIGGSIPGSVGFTYARTKGIPSEGKYAKKTLPSAQNGEEMQYYQNGLDFQPKTISKNGSWLDNYNEGGVIKDDRGQWDHPGEITEIGSNEITMKGVPYDVLGISDTGDTKLMKPGKDYKFKGKKVTEFPMAKNGLRQEQKGLQNLEDLTNFTNYNKPTKGWLSKYS